MARKRGLQVDVPSCIHAIGEIDTVLFPEHLRRAETETRKEIACHILDIVVHIPLTCRDKLMVQADHIAHRTHQLDVHIVIEIPYCIAPPFEFFLVRGGDAHHIGQLVHGFLALPQLGFQLIHTVQRFRNGRAGLVPALPRMVVPYRRQRFLVGDDLNIHAGIDRERKLLLLIIKNLGRREIQFPDYIRDREISGIGFRFLLRDTQIPPVFFQQAACGLNQVVPLDKRFTFQLFLWQVKFVVLVGRTRTPV